MKTALPAPLEIRGHHLLCLRFFRGRGYDSRFVANMERVAGELRSDPRRTVILTREPDVLCRACPNLDGDQCRREGAPLDGLPARSRDERILSRLGLAPGTAMTYERAQGLVEGLLRRLTVQTLCGQCSWLNLCEEAQEAFSLSPSIFPARS